MPRQQAIIAMEPGFQYCGTMRLEASDEMEEQELIHICFGVRVEILGWLIEGIETIG